MLATPSKRTAEQPPEDERPTKRPTPSSPEEGELDDSDTPSPRLVNPVLPKSPVPETATRPKVDFPFKPKAKNLDTLPNSHSRLNGQEDRTVGVIYDRPMEDDRGMYEEEQRKARSRNGYDPHRRRQIPQFGGDHWEPNDRDRRPSAWEGHRPTHDYYRPRYRDRDRERSPSIHSERSQSPSSTPQRGKHRLPSRHSPAMAFSPPPRNYNVDRLHDQRVQEGYERGRYGDDRYRQDNRSFHHQSDRYYRPGGPWEDHSRDRMRDPYDQERSWYDRPHDDHGSQTPHANSYRPVSPGHASERPPGGGFYRSVPPRPHSSQPLSPVGAPPPPPPSSPPPVPPTHLKDVTLPADHNAISIPFKRPKAPRDAHSPSPFPLPPAREEDVRRAQEKKDAVTDVPSSSVVAPQRRRREPVQRTRKEEMAIYGRTFEGCGQQSDYDATTKLGEGTFGEVHKAIQKATRRTVALKRILMHNEKEGMPITALREIKILKAMHHPCIVEILDMFVVRSKGKDSPLSVYMVFPYMDHDLAGLLENERVSLSPSQIKLYMKQLLEGTEYMHRNHILHRDMKAANLLIDNSGSLRIADFGLARAYDPAIVHGVRDHNGKEKKYTNCVVTRWYRPPELLLGARQYGGEVDMWGIGCVLGEMFMRRPILPGTSDIDQLDKIWQLCGTPNQHTWPNFDALPGCEGVKRFPNYSKKLRTAYESIGAETCDLMDKLLTCNPRERITASAALDHEYFWTDPLPADPKSLPTYESSHEFDKRGRRNQPPPGVPPPDNFRPHPPAGHPPYHGRAPPARESFRAGPPPPPVLVTALMQGASMGHGPHPSFSRMPPYPPPPPRNPGPGPPGHGFPPRPGHPLPDPPSHLPAKPSVPLGAQAHRYTGRPERSGPRRYGGGGRSLPPASESNGNGGLPYGEG
ncbi:kinase-like domain-containing protein [Scleroderma yunnanense]